MRLNATKLGVASGTLWGLCLFAMTLISMATGYGEAFLMLLPSVYPGYAISALGSFLGLVYGFVDGFVSLFLLGWLYNYLNEPKSAS